MSFVFEVSHEDIKRLDAVQLTKILSKLLYLESDKYGIAQSCVSCSLNITVSDGGEDGLVKWESGSIKY